MKLIRDFIDAMNRLAAAIERADATLAQANTYRDIGRARAGNIAKLQEIGADAEAVNTQRERKP